MPKSIREMISESSIDLFGNRVLNQIKLERKNGSKYKAAPYKTFLTMKAVHQLLI